MIKKKKKSSKIIEAMPLDLDSLHKKVVYRVIHQTPPLTMLS